MDIEKERRNDILFAKVMIFVLPLSLIYDFFLYTTNSFPMPDIMWKLPLSVFFGLIAGLLFSIILMYMYRNRWDAKEDPKDWNMRKGMYGRLMAAFVLLPIILIGIIYFLLSPITIFVSSLLFNGIITVYMIDKKIMIKEKK